jgi:hypothetical protein
MLSRFGVIDIPYNYVPFPCSCHLFLFFSIFPLFSAYIQNIFKRFDLERSRLLAKRAAAFPL